MARLNHFNRVVPLLAIGLGAVLFLGACNRTVRSPEKSGASSVSDPQTSGLYPHQPVFVTTRAHGEAFKSNPNACKTCHGENLKGGNSKKSCNQCHAAYPHGDAFSKTAEHGIAFMADKTQCLSCHNSQRPDTGVAKKDCKECHAYPHPVAKANGGDGHQWLQGGHGKKFLEDPASCKKCHGEKLDGARTQVSCNSCHSAYPHPANFASLPSGKGHGAEFLKDKAQCLTCHSGSSGDSQKVEKSAPKCQTCHQYPHNTHDSAASAQWHKPENHGDAYIKAQDKSSCLKCHGEESAFKKNHPTNFVSCSSCHALLPHPEGFNYDHKESAHGYGQGPDRSTRAFCTACHYDLKRLMKPNESGEQKGCLECHDLENLGERPRVKWVAPESP